MLHESPVAVVQLEQLPSTNIDRHLGNLYPEAIVWKKIHGEAVASIVDKLVTNELNDTCHSAEFVREFEASREQIVFAARHHDVGLLYLGKDVKPAERDRIVNKNGPLTPEEMAIMDRHPITGVRILEAVGVKDPVILAIVALHHTLQQRAYPAENDPELQEILAAVPANKQDVVKVATQLLVLADVVRTIREKRSYKDEEGVGEAYGKLHMENLWNNKQISCAVQHCERSLQSYPINLE